MPWDEVEVSNNRACLGRLYFHVQGGIKSAGQHWLNVKFPKSVIRVPFRILTEDEEKMLSTRTTRPSDKQVKEAFKREVSVGTFAHAYVGTRERRLACQPFLVATYAAILK